MELKSMTFVPYPDRGAVPDTVTVTMTIKEAAAIATVFGLLNGYAMVKLGVPDSSIFYTLEGVFNRFWENGTVEVLDTDCALHDLNSPVSS